MSDSELREAAVQKFLGEKKCGRLVAELDAFRQGWDAVLAASPTPTSELREALQKYVYSLIHGACRMGSCVRCDLEKLLAASSTIKGECTCKGRMNKYWQADDDCPIHGEKKSAASPTSSAEPSQLLTEGDTVRQTDRSGPPSVADTLIPDWSAGDVIDAEPDGTIVLDDSITTWNPERATRFLVARAVAEEREACAKLIENNVKNLQMVFEFQRGQSLGGEQ